MASNDRIDVPLTQAWRESQEQIDKFFLHGLSNGVASAYIRSAHASGKSTSLVAHIHALTQRSMPEARIIYVVPQDAEAVMLRTYLTSVSANPLNPITIKLSEDPSLGFAAIVSHKTFLATFKPHDVSDKTIVLIDTQSCPTTDGELAPGTLLHWAYILRRQSGNGSGNAVVVKSPFKSGRTLAALERWTESTVKMVTVSDSYPRIKVIRIKTDTTWDQQLDKLFAKCHSAGSHHRVLASTASEYHPDLPSASEVTDTAKDWNSIPRAVANSTAFIRPEVVTTRQVMSQLEFMNEYAWVLKSAAPSEVKFFAPFTEEDLLTGPGFHEDDPEGTAYHEDIAWTILRMVETWPGLHFFDMPIRVPYDIRAVREICRRLLAVRGIESAWDDGVYRLAKKGERVLAIREHAGQIQDFHVAYFLSSIDDNPSFSDSLKRVIIRIAAIFAENVGQLYEMVDESAAQSLDDLVRASTGVGSRRVRRGAAWLSLGVWQKATTSADRTESGRLLVSHDHAKLIAERVKSLENHYKLSPASDELKSTELTEEEMDHVDRQLVWAWLHHIVFFPDANALPFDVVSMKDLETNEHDFVDVKVLLKSLHNDGGPKNVMKDITFIPHRIVDEVEDALGMTPHRVVGTTFPLQR
ncbi:Uu.00g008970.m01.CDS01 [Anthostomella pinea]|uniref:Uu.00g008970.m01.CDS01 n=1 Tax=Anthostomella pinea TaxID=933095 RepID=A0AAI8VYI7_9PEZI|nr:Uu.00g008970.m01.CDS01 [Anthostomella pinea]